MHQLPRIRHQTKVTLYSSPSHPARELTLPHTHMHSKSQINTKKTRKSHGIYAAGEGDCRFDNIEEGNFSTWQPKQSPKANQKKI